MKYATGYVPDPEGHQRTPFARLATRLGAAAPGATPSSASMRPAVPSILDQGPTSSCTGHASAMGWFLALSFMTSHVASNWDWIPSQSEIYRNGRAIDRTDLHTPLTDDGAQPNQVFRAINEFGVRPMRGPTSDGRNSDAELRTINDEPKLGDLEDEALTVPLGEYGIAAVGPQRIQALRQALSSNRPVCVAIAGGSAAFQNYAHGVLPALKSPLDHYVLLIGYYTDAAGKTVFECLNSWGVSWGEGGYCWLSEEAAQELGDLVVLDARIK